MAGVRRSRGRTARPGSPAEPGGRNGACWGAFCSTTTSSMTWPTCCAPTIFISIRTSGFTGRFCVCTIRGRTVSTPLRSNEALEKQNELKEVGGDDYLIELLESVPHSGHGQYYSKIIREKAIQRRLIFACTDILRDAYDDTSRPKTFSTRPNSRFSPSSNSRKPAARSNCRRS